MRSQTDVGYCSAGVGEGVISMGNSLRRWLKGMGEQVKGASGSQERCVKMVAVALEMSGLQTWTAVCETPKEHH